MPVKGRRNSPNPALSFPELTLFGFRVFDKAIGRVGDYRMNAVLLAAFQPLEAVVPIEYCPAVDKYRFGQP